MGEVGEAQEGKREHDEERQHDEPLSVFRLWVRPREKRRTAHSLVGSAEGGRTLVF